MLASFKAATAAIRASAGPATRLALIAALALACADPSTPTGTPGGNPGNPGGPGATTGVVSGWVTLLGADGLPRPAGQRVSLFTTRADYEVRHASYEGTLHDIGVDGRYVFSISNVAPGDYFLVVCWEFGCGDYRDRDTGDLIRVRVDAGHVTSLHFTL